MKAVHVWWVDSVTDLGWHDKAIGGPSLIESVGWVIHRTDDFIVLTTSIGSSGKFLDQLTIPVRCVRKMTKLQVPK